MGRFSRKLLSAAVALSVVISGIGIVPAYAEGESEPEEAVSNTEPAPVGTDGEGDSAEEATIDTIVVYGEEQSVSHDYNGLSNDELMAYYVQRMIDDSLASPYSRPAMDYGGLSAGVQLTGNDRALYNYLKTKIQAVAAGTITSTAFELPLSAFGITKTKFYEADLGAPVVELVGNTYQVTDAARNAFTAMLDFDFNAVLDALLSDLPFDLYWYDKTSTGGSVCSGYGIGASGNSQDGFYLYLSTTPILTMYVSVNYAVNKEQYKTTEVDSSKIATVNTAITNAQSIANAHKNEELVTMLTSYKNEICNLVDYDHDAIAAPKAPYGDPWQLIHVFDGVSSTKVVCEGYSKAFKYLCDLSGMTNATCLIATGTMAGGTGAGGHMWNVINMDDNRSYMIDVTNCDTGAAGYPDKLFLKVPASGSYSTSYVFSTGSSSNITYTYDEDTIATIPEKYLTLSTTAYTGPVVESRAIVAASSATLGSEIGLNYYLIIPNDVFSAGVTAVMNGPKGEKSIAVTSDLKNSEGKYVFTYKVNAIQMNVPVSIKLIDTSSNVINLYNSSDVQCSNNIYSDTVYGYLKKLEVYDNDKYSRLATAMINYGAYSELFFNGSTEIIYTALQDLSVDDLKTFETKYSGTKPDTITIKSAALTLGSATSYRLTFSSTDGLNGHTFTLNGDPVTPESEGDDYVIVISNIGAKKLNKQYHVTIDGYNITFYPLTYAFNVLNYAPTNTKLVNLSKSIYEYSNAVINCFGE